MPQAFLALVIITATGLVGLTIVFQEGDLYFEVTLTSIDLHGLDGLKGKILVHIENRGENQITIENINVTVLDNNNDRIIYQNVGIKDINLEPQQGVEFNVSWFIDYIPDEVKGILECDYSENHGAYNEHIYRFKVINPWDFI
jgi:hypothetical protein